MNYDISVIHLKRSKLRKKNINLLKKYFSPKNINVFNAIDGKKITPRDITKYQMMGYLSDEIKYDHICKRPLTKQHFAIWLSHVTLWESLLQMPLPSPKFHLIFEDDVVIQNDFDDLLHEWYNRTARFKNMDFVHLYVFDYQARDLQKKSIHKTFDALSGLQCYIVRHSHLKKLVEQIKPLITAIDEQVTRLPLKSYFIYDDFVTHGAISSENRY